MAVDTLVARRTRRSANALASCEVTLADAVARASTASEVLDLILADTLQRRASGLHLDCEDGGIVARLRIGGILREMLTLRGDAASAFVACLRNRAGLDAGCDGEDGRLTLFADGAASDWLVTSLATSDGVRLHLRPTGGTVVIDPLAALGMAPAMVRTINSALLDHTGGVVVVAGPARSGRTTTLRALLDRLNVGTRRVLAIGGDAVSGLGHVAIDPADPRASASALRAVLRQDPDVVLLDDSPDRETAQLVFEAARTRRLLLIGIESDDALAAIARLRALRVERFLLASTLRIVIAQRLVQRLCAACRRPVQAPGSVSALLGFDPGAVVFASDGCERCGGTGHRGDVAVFEAIACDSAIGRLLNDGGDAAILARHAFVAAPDLGSAARALVREGLTSPAEALRIARGRAVAG